jgi:hypothetical protein
MYSRFLGLSASFGYVRVQLESTADLFEATRQQEVPF